MASGIRMGRFYLPRGARAHFSAIREPKPGRALSSLHRDALGREALRGNLDRGRAPVGADEAAAEAGGGDEGGAASAHEIGHGGAGAAGGADDPIQEALGLL